MEAYFLFMSFQEYVINFIDPRLTTLAKIHY